MIDLCQWRVCIGIFNGSRGYCRSSKAEKSFVGVDPLVRCLVGTVTSLVFLVVSVIGAVDATTATTKEGTYIFSYSVAIAMCKYFRR